MRSTIHNLFFPLSILGTGNAASSAVLYGAGASVVLDAGETEPLVVTKAYLKSLEARLTSCEASNAAQDIAIDANAAAIDNLEFKPADIGGGALDLWLDASDSTTLFTNNAGTNLATFSNNVRNWKDKSGNGNHARCSDSESGGVFVSNSGGPAVDIRAGTSG